MKPTLQFIFSGNPQEMLDSYYITSAEDYVKIKCPELKIETTVSVSKLRKCFNEIGYGTTSTLADYHAIKELVKWFLIEQSYVEYENIPK